MTHAHTTYLSDPSSDTFIVFTDAPQPQQAYIALHKSNSLRAEERRKLLSIMTHASEVELCKQYLNDLETRLNQMDTIHHPAVKPGRQIIADIRRKQSSDPAILEVLHFTLKLAMTPADSPDFHQTTTDYLQTSRNVNAEANGSYLAGACIAFAAACTIAVTVALGVMMGSNTAADILINAVIYGLTGVMSLTIGIFSISLFNRGHTLKTAANNMRAFETAMHETPADEHRATQYTMPS